MSGPFYKLQLDGEIDVASKFVGFAKRFALRLKHAGQLKTETDEVLVIVTCRAPNFYTLYIKGKDCSDIKSHLLLWKPREAQEDPHEYYASLPTTVIERINPPERLPRPEPDPATFTKRMKVPPELLIGQAPSPWRAPGGYMRTSAMYSGQMRKAASCYHLLGENSPFGYTWGKTHGILEYPASRSGDLDGTNPPGSDFWLIEISPLGVYAFHIGQLGEKCCKLPAKIKPLLASDEEVAANSELEKMRDEVDLYWARVSRPSLQITELVSATEMTDLYAKGAPMAAAHGWAFSYSGHQAANVIFEPHAKPDNFWRVNYVTLHFTGLVNAQGERLVSANLIYTEGPFDINNGVQTLVWFQSEAYPGYYEQFYPFSFALGGTTGQTTFSDVPIYVYYDGDTANVLRMSQTPAPLSGWTAWSDADHGYCVTWFGAGDWTSGGTVFRKNYSPGATIGELSFAGAAFESISGSYTYEEYWSDAPVFREFCLSDRYTVQGGECCAPGFPNTIAEGWTEHWEHNVGYYKESNSGASAAAAVLSMGDRESLYLGSRIGGVYRTVNAWYRLAGIRKASIQICFGDIVGSGIAKGTCGMSSLPGGPACILSDGIGGCRPTQAYYIADQVTTAADEFNNSPIDKGSAFMGGVTFALSETADIGKFFIAKNPAILEPIYSPGPVGFHGNMVYYEKAMAKEKVRVPPTYDYVINENGPDSKWRSSGGFTLEHPGSGSILTPLAFVGKV